MRVLVSQKMMWHFAREEMILWVQQRFPSLFINIVTFIRANLSRRTSFRLASNGCWPLFSAFERDFPSLWKRALLSSRLLAVAGSWEEVGGRVALQPCSIFSVQYAIAVSGVWKVTASMAGSVSTKFVLHFPYQVYWFMKCTYMKLINEMYLSYGWQDGPHSNGFDLFYFKNIHWPSICKTNNHFLQNV